MRIMRHIAIIVGSSSDLPQCAKGLKWIKKHPDLIQIKEKNIFVSSQHRHTLNTQRLLNWLSQERYLDAIIVGAGWSAALPGCSDAFLRFKLTNNWLPVIGVAFADPKNKRHTEAAILSITEVPGTQVIFTNKAGEQFVGEQGFLKACQFAAKGKLPRITLKTPPRPLKLTLEEALELATAPKP